MDFGIARAISDASSTMTQTAAVVGTAQYLSPEQARGETVDSRSDVYSAGCLLYELLTGRPPFVGDSPVAVAYQHVREPARPPSDHDTDLPPAVDAIVMKSLAKRLEDRYQSAAAMRADIERYLAGRPVQAPVPAPVPVPPPNPTAEHTSTVVRPPVPPPDEYDDDEYERRGPRPLILVLLGLLVLALIAGAWIALRSDLFESAPEQDQVPNLIGMTEAEARDAIADAGLEVGNVDFEASETVDDEEVIRQDPSADLYVDPGTSVDIVVSSGLPMVQVPFVVGLSQEEARNQLRAAKLDPQFQSTESDEPQGQVLSTDPQPGQPVRQGSVVAVTISKGPKEVPNVVGMNRSDAIQRILDAGFKFDIRADRESTEPRGTVTDQLPPGGEPHDQGTVVTLFVSVYEPPPPPPPTETPPPTVPPTTPPTEGTDRVSGRPSP
jgi:serine/threonine-protein kinase